eukprot:gene15739-20114_t
MPTMPTVLPTQLPTAPPSNVVPCQLSTFIGTGVSASSGDSGPAALASIMQPIGVWADTIGNVFVSETTKIREVSVSGIVSTVAGGGSLISDGVPATSVVLSSPGQIYGDTNANLYFVDTTKI